MAVDKKQPTQAQTAVAVEELVAQDNLAPILDEVLNKLEITEGANREDVRAALALLISQVADVGPDSLTRLDSLLGEVCSTLEQKVHRQVDEILHAPTFQQYEARWSGLAQLVGESTGGAQVSVLSAALEEIREDLTDNDLGESAMHAQLYKKGIGQEGETPIGAIIAGFGFGTTAQDAKLLKNLSNLAAEIHAPFFANLDPSGIKKDWMSFDGLPTLTAGQIKELFAEENKPDWMGLRNHPNSRYIGLLMPRVVGRLPYDKDTNPAGPGLKNYTEHLSGRADHLYISASYLLGRQILRSFARTGLPSNIAGRESGGLIEGLVAPKFDAIPGQVEGNFPTEVLIDYKQEHALSVDVGLIPVIAKKGSTEAFFIGLPSVQRPKDFGNTAAGQDATINFARATLLDNMLLVSRFAHCVNHMQRALGGAKLDGTVIKKRIEEWLNDFKYPPQPMDPELAQKHPIKSFSVNVTPHPKRPGWYSVDVQITPIDPYQGADIALSFVKEGQPKG